LAYLSVGMGGMRLKKPLPRTVHHATYTRGHPVEAECMVDDRVFAGIGKPHIPELRKKNDGWWRTPTLEMVSP